MSKKKVIAIIFIIIAVGLLIAGGILIFQNYSNKNRIVTSFNELKASLEKTFSNNNGNIENIKETASGNTKFYINPLLGNSEDGSDIIINNLNNTILNYEYRLDTAAKKMYFDGSLLFNMQELMGINFYQNENISYILLRNIFDKYITIENSDIFSYLEESKKATEDINYIYDKIIESLGNNITDDDIKVANQDGKKKISLELNEERLNEISKNIVDDLKKDKKAKEILGEGLDNLETTSSTLESNKNTTTTNNASLNYSIFLEKNEIVTYEFAIKDNNENYSIEFNNGNEKSFVIKEGNTESLKAIIEESNDTTTINLSSNNTSIGSITINENNIGINIVDEATGTGINANITSATENNIITTNVNISMLTSGTNIDIIKVTDTKTITEGVADFTNINTTNNVNINNLTEEELTMIETNLMTVLYNFMGIAI